MQPRWHTPAAMQSKGRLLLGLSGKRLLERERSEPSHSAKLLSASSEATDRFEPPERLLGGPLSSNSCCTAATRLPSHSACMDNNQAGA